MARATSPARRPRCCRPYRSRPLRNPRTTSRAPYRACASAPTPTEPVRVSDRVCREARKQLFHHLDRALGFRAIGDLVAVVPAFGELLGADGDHHDAVAFGAAFNIAIGETV